MHYETSTILEYEYRRVFLKKSNAMSSNFLPGCLTSHDEHSILSFDTNCSGSCVKRMTIRTFGIFSNKNCTIDWVRSSFSANNQYWKSTEKFKNEFSLTSNNTAMPRRLHIQVFKTLMLTSITSSLIEQWRYYTEETYTYCGQFLILLYKNHTSSILLQFAAAIWLATLLAIYFRLIPKLPSAGQVHCWNYALIAVRLITQVNTSAWSSSLLANTHAIWYVNIYLFTSDYESK
jgi:hypothetical protein